LVASGLLMAGAVCGLVLLAGQMMGGPLDRLLEIAQSAPTRSLAQALATDGEAWIKVRFELASGAAPLPAPPPLPDNFPQPGWGKSRKSPQGIEGSGV
jgi:hypothetical protein